MNKTQKNARRLVVRHEPQQKPITITRRLAVKHEPQQNQATKEQSPPIL